MRKVKAKLGKPVVTQYVTIVTDVFTARR